MAVDKNACKLLQCWIACCQCGFVAWQKVCFARSIWKIQAEFVGWNADWRKSLIWNRENSQGFWWKQNQEYSLKGLFYEKGISSLRLSFRVWCRYPFWQKTGWFGQKSIFQTRIHFSEWRWQPVSFWKKADDEHWNACNSCPWKRGILSVAC